MEINCCEFCLFIRHGEIAGIYGMNFQYMPEPRLEIRLETVLLGMGAVCGGLWLGFKRSGWR